MDTDRFNNTHDETLLKRRPWYVLAVALFLLSAVTRQPIAFLAALFAFVVASVPEIWYRLALRHLALRQQVNQKYAFFGETLTLSALGRLLPYFGSPMDALVDAERFTLPLGTTVVLVSAAAVIRETTIESLVAPQMQCFRAREIPLSLLQDLLRRGNFCLPHPFIQWLARLTGRAGAHAQRLEQVLLDILRKGQARHLLHNIAGQRIPVTGIGGQFTGRAYPRRDMLSQPLAQRLQIAGRACLGTSSPVFEPGRIGQQIGQGDQGCCKVRASPPCK